MAVNTLGKSFLPDPRTVPLTTYIGFVKRNDDAQRMGRLSVFIPELGGDPTDPGAWIIVGYASPFAGATDQANIQQNSQTMDGSQKAYGFWMIPPDLNNEVAVFFANGDIARGYWFACCYQQNMNHMVPGIATDVTTEPAPPLKTGPVVEYNKANVASTTSPRRPRFTPLSDGLATEGLTSDFERGSASTSARREAPSQVFGFLSPRGNTVHIDDNTTNEFIRLRTRSGAQILIHETTGYVYINSKNGLSWLEVSDSGVDIYTALSVSMRAQQDVNIRADRNIILDANANIFMRAGNNITMSAGTDIRGSAGANLTLSAEANGTLNVVADFQAKAGANVRLQSGRDTTQLAGGKQIRSGTTIFDNTGSAPAASAAQDALTPTGGMVGDAKQSLSNGASTWKANGSTLNTIVSRMPTHEPWQPHPNSKVPPPPLEQVDINAAPTYGVENSSNVMPDGSLNDAGCSTGAAGTKPISSDVFSAITNAATKTGVPPAIMFAFADIESSFKPGVGNAQGSSATGLYQFMPGTWSDMVNKYGSTYNVSKDQINDPTANALIGGQYIKDNTAILQKGGIVNPSAGQLYIMHMMGSSGGPALLAAAQKTPDANAASMFPAAAASNPAFGNGRTVSQVVANLSAMADSKAAAYAGQYNLPPPCQRSTGTANTPGGAPPAASGVTPSGTSAGSPGTAKVQALYGQRVLDKNGESQCVALVKQTNGLGPTSTWVPGQPITQDNIASIPPGTAVATFSSNGKYTNSLDGSSHAAVLLGPTADGTGMRVAEQYVGATGAVHETVYPFHPGNKVFNNAANYSVINTKTG